MTKDVGILILGLVVAGMPFLGFPVNIERTILVIAGLAIALLAFLIRGDFSLFAVTKTGDTFTENDINDLSGNVKADHEAKGE